MDTNLVDQAINLALKGNWEEVIKINKKILSEDSEDIEALNRLARAYFESNDLKNAKKTSQKVLSIEPSNKIAERALEKYKRSLPTAVGKKSIAIEQNIVASDFIEETGTTKQVNLIYLCSEDIISSLDSGDEVLLSTHAHRVAVSTLNNKYIGKLPDDLSAKIKMLTKNGYAYKTIIKSADKQNIKVIIKEIKRGKGFENKQSFPREASESVGEFSS